jgi:sugar lactone lactonase YvrE
MSLFRRCSFWLALLCIGGYAHAQTAPSPSPSAEIPGTITNLAATVKSPGGTVIHLTWEGGSGATNFEIWRAVGIDLAQASLVGTNKPGIMGFDDDTTRADVTYGYWVRGYNEAGHGPFTNAVTAVQTNQLWMVSMAGDTRTPVVGGNGTAFLAGMNKQGALADRIAAYEPDGTLLWEDAESPLWCGAPSLAGNGTLIIPSFRTGVPGTLLIQAVSDTGERLWSTKVGQGYPTDTDATVDAYGTAYVAFNDQVASSAMVAAVSSEGVLLWTASTGKISHHVTLGTDGKVVIAGNNGIYLGGTLMGVTPEGRIAWSHCTGAMGYNYSGTAVDAAGNLVLLGWVASTLSLHRLTPDGEWLSTNAAPFYQAQSQCEPVIAADGSVYSRLASLVVAFEPDGSVRWTNTVKGPSSLDSNPVGICALDREDRVYVLGWDAVHVFDRTGVLAGRIELGNRPCAAPVLTPDGHLYVPCRDRVYVLRALGGLATDAPWPMYRQNPAGTGSRPSVPQPPSKPVILPALTMPSRVRVPIAPRSAPVALRLYRSETANFAEATLAAVSSLGQPYVDDTNAIPGVTYHYWLDGRNVGGTSLISGPVTGMAVEVPTRWQIMAAGLGTNAPAIGPDGAVYTWTPTKLLALEADGSSRWEIVGLSNAPVVAADGTLRVRCATNLYSLSPTGGTNWICPNLAASKMGLPALGAADQAIVPLSSTGLASISVTGTVEWVAKTSWAAEPSIAQDGSIVTHAQTYLARHDWQGNALLSSNLTGLSARGEAPVLGADAAMYLHGSYSRESALVAVAADGQERWRFTSATKDRNFAVVDVDGRVFAMRTINNPDYGVMASAAWYQSEVAAVNPDGSLAWSTVVPKSFASPTLGARHTLFVTAETMLYALSTVDGRILWQLECPARTVFGTSILDYDGTLYLPFEGGLMALDVGMGPASSPWPMYRQNPRQTACIARGAAPSARILNSSPEGLRLEVLAPAGAVLLESADLLHWHRCRHLPAEPGSVLHPVEAGRGQGFYRVLSP